MNKENKSGKWREYWLDPLLSPRNSIYTEPSETCIHVIEYTAFEHAATKCEEAQSELLSCRKELEKLKAKLQITVDALKEVRDFDSGQPYAYCVGFLQEEARGALKKIDGEK